MKQTSPYLTVQSLGGFGLAGTGTHKNSVLGHLINFYWIYNFADNPCLSLFDIRDIIEVGRGPYVGEDVILYWNSTGAEYTHDVGALAFITDGVDGAWQFSPIPGSLELILYYNYFFL